MADLTLWLSAARGLAGALTLGYASVTDLRTRRVDNRVWLAVGGVGAALLVAQAGTVGFPQPLLLITIPIVVALAYGLYRTGLLFGGADAKALMALAFLIPFHAGLPGTPFLASPLTAAMFPIAVLGNALIATLLYPPGLFVYNAAHGDVAIPEAFVGYRIDLDDLRDTKAWPMEHVDDDGEIQRSYMPSRSQAEATVDELRKAGVDEVWVTPKIPFMVPLAVGFVAAFLFGDLLSALVRGVLPI